ncbi:MAG: winged helix-turn-helix transcriptional regulator [Ruminiclostridium sp.]|nr:winged helix-turn-helix transcriptional regulator [Ruminiclostridium sp.]
MKISETFKILSDDQRRDIITMLRGGRMNAGEIADRLGITPAALSYHLRLLRKADMIIEYKEKNFIYYELNTSVFDEVILWLGQFGARSDSAGKEKAGNEE